MGTYTPSYNTTEQWQAGEKDTSKINKTTLKVAHWFELVIDLVFRPL